MPAYIIYVLIIFGISVAAGIGFELGEGLGGVLATIGFVVIIGALWEPLLKPLIKKMTK